MKSTWRYQVAGFSKWIFGLMVNSPSGRGCWCRPSGKAGAPTTCVRSTSKVPEETAVARGWRSSPPGVSASTSSPASPSLWSSHSSTSPTGAPISRASSRSKCRSSSKPPWKRHGGWRTYMPYGFSPVARYASCRGPSRLLPLTIFSGHLRDLCVIHLSFSGFQGVAVWQ